MISRTNLKLVIGIILISLLIFFSDQIPDFLVWLYHSLLELAHTLFEVIEETLDILIEVLFGTDLHETQIIVFYIMLAFAFWALYKLALAAPRWYRNWAHNIVNAYSEQKEAIVSEWQLLTLSGKFKWIALLMAWLYGLSFLLF